MNIKIIIKRLVISFIAIIIITGIGIYMILRYQAAVVKSVDESGKTFSKKSPNDYLEIFAANKKLNLVGTFYYKKRNPVSVYVFNDNYEILLYKIQSENEQPLNQFVKEDELNVHMTYSVNYFNLLDDPYILDELNIKENTSLQIFYKLEPPVQTKKIYLTLWGRDINQIEKNDSIVYYHLFFDNFSVKNQDDGEQDFYGTVRNNNLAVQLPLEIMFLKRDKNIYLIIMMVRNENAELNIGSLKDLLSAK